MENPLIRMKNVDVAYQKDLVLSNISLTILPRDFLGIIGPNGGGKTTLIRTILGFTFLSFISMMMSTVGTGFLYLFFGIGVSFRFWGRGYCRDGPGTCQPDRPARATRPLLPKVGRARSRPLPVRTTHPIAPA